MGIESFFSSSDLGKCFVQYSHCDFTFFPQGFPLFIPVLRIVGQVITGWGDGVREGDEDEVEEEGEDGDGDGDSEDAWEEGEVEEDDEEF